MHISDRGLIHASQSRCLQACWWISRSVNGWQMFATHEDTYQGDIIGLGSLSVFTPCWKAHNTHSQCLLRVTVSMWLLHPVWIELYWPNIWFLLNVRMKRILALLLHWFSKYCVKWECEMWNENAMLKKRSIKNWAFWWWWWWAFKWPLLLKSLQIG